MVLYPLQELDVEDRLRYIASQRRRWRALAESDYADLRPIGKRYLREIEAAVALEYLDPESKALRAWEEE